MWSLAVLKYLTRSSETTQKIVLYKVSMIILPSHHDYLFVSFFLSLQDQKNYQLTDTKFLSS